MTTILLIDDERDVRDSVCKVLTRAGFTVHAESNAMDGLRYIEKNSVDLIITDLIMAGMNGVEAIQQIRLNDKNIKIIAVSGGGDFGSAAYRPNAIMTSAYLEAAADAGADVVLTKPFERIDLIAAVEVALKSWACLLTKIVVRARRRAFDH